MSLRDYGEDTQIIEELMQKDLYAVICIHQNPDKVPNSDYHMNWEGSGSIMTEGPINCMLENVQEQLERKRSLYRKIYLAYVYEPYVHVIEFHEFPSDARVFYKESPVWAESIPTKKEMYSLAHVVLRSLTMLQSEQAAQGDRVLYLLTDIDIDRENENQLLYEGTDRQHVHPLLEKTQFQSVLVKSINVPESVLESYLAEEKNGQVCVISGEQKL